MSEITEYHLHKNIFSKVHLEVKVLEPYLKEHWDKAVRAHRHSFYQIIWFAQKGRHFVDYQVIDHPANSIFFLNKGQIHYFCPDAANAGFAIHFNEQFTARFSRGEHSSDLHELFNEIGSPYVELESGELKNFETLLNLLREELIAEKPKYARQSYFLLSAMITLIERKRGTSEFKTNGNDYELAMRFRRLVDQHLDASHQIGFFSSILHITDKKLTRAVKQHLNDTPAVVIQKRKILEAKRKLANRKIPVKEIAYDLGFDQPSNFTKYFKKHTGILPKEFQKMLP